MNIPLDEVIYFDCITTHPTTGAATDADSTPTFAVYEESTDTDIGVGGNLTKRTSLTGNYRGTFTLSAANGFEVGKWYSIIVSATVNSIAGKAVAKNFRVVAAESIAGYPKVDEHALKGDAQSATDLKDFADDGYDPATNKVQGVVLVDTATTLTNLPAITPNWLTAAGLATDAVQEIRDAITGGAYALDTDANGRIRIVDGTGVGELDTLSGTVLLRSATQASIDAIEADSNELQTDWTNGGRLDLLLDALINNGTSEWVWVDPTNGTSGGDGSVGDPVNSLTAAYALGSRIKFVAGIGGTYAMPVITFNAGLVLDINGWRISSAANATFSSGFERIFSSSPGGRLIATGGTITFGLAVEISNITVECTTFTCKYGYFKDVYFNCGITFAAHNFAVATDFYGCWFRNGAINTASAYGGGIGIVGHIFNLLGCYGEINLQGLKSTATGVDGQTFIHLGWGQLNIEASCTGGIVTHTSHVEVDDASGGAVTIELVSDGTADDATLAAIAALNDISTTDVWAAANRTLTAFDEDSTTIDIDATIRSAVGMAAADLDTQLSTIAANVVLVLDDTGTSGVIVASGSKTGYSLASTGLDSIAITAPTGVASNFREMVVQLWRRFFKRTTKDASNIKTYADNGTSVLTTQAYTSSGDDDDVGAAT